MRYSQILASTIRETSSTVNIKSQETLIRAGYVRQLSAGIFCQMHFGKKSMEKIKDILREEMNAIGGVEISMPVVHPADIWKKTGRYDDIDESLVRFSDRAKRNLVLAMTHEEVVSWLAKTDISTYKQLPKLVYQIQMKFRDEARPRAGLIRVREFEMKDSYSLDTSWEGLEKQYFAHYDAYFRMFARADLPVIAIQSDVGMMGGKVAHEYMYITEIGEDTIFICESTGYMANKEVADIKKIYPEPSEQLPTEKKHTPGTKTIEDVANFLGVTPKDCGKIVFFTGQVDGEEKVIIGVVRGDMEVNPIKLQKIVKAKYLFPAEEEQILAIGSVPGYATPVGIDRSKAIVVVDDLVAKTNNLVLGANEDDHHTINVCYGRDYEADFVADIIAAYDGALAPDAKSDDDVLKSVRGVEVGNIFQLGTKYSIGLEANFTDSDGKGKPIIMGSYGIGVGRLLACIAEEYNDEDGLIMPISVAPYEVVLVGLLDNEEVVAEAEKLYADLQAAGIDVLFDDRGKKVARPGEKFSDADLIGIPIRLTISKRSLKNGGVELKLRSESEKEIVPLDQVVSKAVELKTELFRKINEKVENIVESLNR